MEAFETKLQELIGKYTSDERPAELQEAVVNDLQSLLSSSENVKQTFSTLRKERLNAEHQLCQLEKQLISLNSKLGKETRESAKLRKSLETSDSALEAKQELLRKTDDEKTELAIKYNKVLSERNQLDDEKSSLLEVLEKKSKEIERLDDEWKSMSQKLSEAMKASYEAQAKLDEFKSSDITREFKLKRLEQEKDLLGSQNTRLSTELQGKIEELATLKKNKTNEVLDLQNLADNQKEEIKLLKSSNESVKSVCEEQESKLETLMGKLKRAREELAETEGHMEQELSAKTKLVDLYKESSEDSKRKINEMTSAIEELRNILKETDDAKTELEAKLELAEKEHKSQTDKLEERVSKLSTELNNANDLLEVSKKKAPSLSKEALEGMSPTAAAASALMKKGMTLTQIYSEYVEVSDALEAEKDENASLKQYLDQILQEIEEKAPVLQRQKEDYEMALKTIENLTSKFDAALEECGKYRTDQEDAVRKADLTKRENGRLNTLCIDLSQQVRVLLKEVEEARGGVVSSDYQVPELISSDKVSSSSQVISEHLVSFKNIEELQEQNQKLLAVVRDLSEEREKQEQECSPEKMKELASKLDFAFEQVSQMKEEREKQEEIIQTLVKQRDMYKVLYNAEDRPEVSSTSFMQQSVQSQSSEAEAELQKAKAYLSRVTEEYEKYKKIYKEKETSMLARTEKIEGEVSTLRVENQHLKGKLEFIEEKDDMLKQTNEGLKREADALTEKSRGLETALSKLQKEAAFYKQELEAANEKLINSEVGLKSAATEKRLMKGTEMRLMQENKTLIEQQRTQNVLLTNLQTIQNNLERQEFETRKALGKQVESLQLEMKTLRRKFDLEETEKKSSIGSLNGQLEKITKQVEEELKLRKEAESKLEELTQEAETSKAKCAELEEQLAASEARLKALVDEEQSSATQDIKDLKEQYEEKQKTLQSKLSEGESRMKALISQAQNASKHVEQYKQIASSCEQALKDANEKFASLQKESSGKSNIMQQRINDLSRQLEATKVELQSRKSRSERTEHGMQSQLDELRGSYSILEAEYNGIQGHVDGYRREAEAAKEEAKKHAITASEKQEKYERELVLHAKDVEELVKIKEQMHEYVKAMDNSEAQIRESQEKMVAAERAMENMKIHHAEEMRKIREHSKGVAEQNTLLHKEIEKLSTQIVDAKSQRIDEITKLTEEGGKSADQSTEDLYEVIRFIRREKEIAETKFEASQSESLRYRQRCDHFEKELEETQAALELERKRTLGLMLSKEEHEELMAKVASVSELTELNKELERIKKELEADHEALKMKAKQLEQDVGPLQQSKKLLEEEKGSWVAEKTALKSEIQRWTTRAQQLIEQNNKANSDLEELKNLKVAKAQNERVTSALRDEIGRLTVQKETMTKEMLRLKKDFSETQGKATLLTTLADTMREEKEQTEKRMAEEIESLKKVAEEKTKDSVEKGKLILKLKSLARKYKSQYEELLKGKEPGETTQPAAPVDNTKVTELEEDNKKLKEEIEKLQAKVEEAEKNVQELNSKAVETTEKDDDLSKRVSELNQEIEKLKKEAETNKATIAEKDEKDERNKKILRSAKEKISDLNSQRDKLANENKELKSTIKEKDEMCQTADENLKEKEMRLNVMKSQYDSEFQKLEKDLRELKDANKNLNDRVQEMEEEKKSADEKLTDLAKALAESEETIVKLKLQASTQHSQDFPVAEPAAIAPLTATVRPTASTVTSQAQKPMSSRTASIRPLIPSVTPTAMVSPTVPPVHPSATQVVAPQQPSRPGSSGAPSGGTEQRAQEVLPGPSRGQASVFKAPRVLATVQAQEGTSTAPETQATVAPIIVSTNEEEERRDREQDREQDQNQEQDQNHDQIQGREESGEGQEDVTSDRLQPSEVADAVGSLITEDDQSVSRAPVEEDQGQQEPREEESQVSDVAVSLSLTPESDFGLIEQADGEATEQIETEKQEQDSSKMKRRRSEGSSPERESQEESEDRPEEKRQRIQQEETDSPDENEQYRESEVISISDGDGDGEGELDDEEEDEDAEEDEDVEEDDDSEESVEEIDEDEDEEDEDDEEGGDEEEAEMFDYEEEEAFEDDQNEMEEGEIEEGEGNEEDEVMEDQEDEIESMQQDSTASEQGQQSTDNQERLTAITPPVPMREPIRELQRRQPSPAAFMLAAQEQSGRGRVFRRRYQLPSFSLPPGQGGSGPFDEADDCTVPSTPTLYEPKRSDGFAEAVSSPQVRHPVFSFPGALEGGNRSQAVGLDAGVNDEGLRLDDTRIDLLAGEEPASVPLTPMGIVPSVTITPVEGLGDEMVLTRQGVIQGRVRESSTARVPHLSSEDNSQEQNVPQHIDLTGDDGDDDDVDDDGEALSTGQQDDDDIFGDSNQQSGQVEEDQEEASQQEEEVTIETAKEEQEESETKAKEQEPEEQKAEQEDDNVPETTQAEVAKTTVVTSTTTATTTRRSGRRPRLRRTVLATRGQTSDDKADTGEQAQ